MIGTPKASRSYFSLILVGVVALCVFGLLLLTRQFWFSNLFHFRSQPNLPISTVTYNCNEGKTITAAFYTNDTDTPTVDAQGMPVPTGSVSLTLSDGRALSLPQTISASGIRYANPDETFIFWSKGNTAFVEEGANQEQTYTGCVTASALPGQDAWNTFASSTMGISVRYPQDYKANAAYAYQALGPGKTIYGVQFTIPPALTQGTNLSLGSGVSVEELPQAISCSASLFLAPGLRSKEVPLVDNDVEYLVATSSDAGAGNFYEEVVYALTDSKPCTAVRYFIHSTNIGNYDPGTVEEFDREALLTQFDQIRQSLVLGR